jgi:hypothetical protein
VENPGLPIALWALLDTRLWHATTPTGLESIFTTREIRITGNRYSNSLCRSLGGICLFDFGPAAEDVANQFKNWIGWFGHEQGCRVPIWLEIDRGAVNTNLLDAGGARAHARANLSKRFIPGVEACHRGALPTSALVSVLMVDRYHHNTFAQCIPERDAFRFALDRFVESLPTAPPENPLLQALRKTWGE